MGAQCLVDQGTLQRLDAILERQVAVRQGGRSPGSDRGSDGWREEIGAERVVAVGERDHALDLVGEFAHVAGPAVPGESGEGLGSEARNAPVEMAIHIVEQAGRDRRNVHRPVLQRRQVHREGGEAVVEIAAEAAGVDLAEQITVGGGDDADVHLARPLRPERANLALLQHAQELDLEGGRGLADLVEEDGAAVGDLEQAGAVLVGAGEGPFLAAEKLALQELVGQRPAVLDHEGLVAAQRAVVDGRASSSLPVPLSPVIRTEMS